MRILTSPGAGCGSSICSIRTSPRACYSAARMRGPYQGRRDRGTSSGGTKARDHVVHEAPARLGDEVRVGASVHERAVDVADPETCEGQEAIGHESGRPEDGEAAGEVRADELRVLGIGSHVLG